MGREGSKLKSAMRKPLRNVSNHGVKSLKSTTKKKEKMPQPDDNRVEQDPLDHLLLVHSDISSILGQIDELVVQVVNVKTTDKNRCKEIKSFADVLSEIGSLLKPWVPRLQKALANCSTEPKIELGETSCGAHTVDEDDAVDTPQLAKQDSLVSPSPLVSWRAADCTIERGKQLFLLTPLPRPNTVMSKAPPISSKPTACEDLPLSSTAPVSSLVAKNVESMKELDFASPSKASMGHFSSLLETPCLKNPPRSCVLLEPTCEFMGRKIDKSHKSTPFPYPKGSGKVYESLDSESSSGDEVSENLGLKYLELIGIKPSCMFKSGSKALEASPAWMTSPPKCCTLLEPPDKNEKPLKDAQELGGTFDQKICLAPRENNIQHNDQVQGNKKFPNQGNFAIIESTPLWKGCESTVRRGKPPGENTLKKELWTRFEAASTSTSGFRSALLESSHKGFLDMLEEASCDETTPYPDSSR